MKLIGTRFFEYAFYFSYFWYEKNIDAALISGEFPSRCRQGAESEY